MITCVYTPNWLAVFWGDGMDCLTLLQRRIPNEQEEILMDCLLEAEELLKGYLGRSALPDCLVYVRVHVAAMLYNCYGIEGQTSYRQGDLAGIFNGMPAHLKAQLAPYRLTVTVQ